jgi:hypothetical protein
MRVLLALLVGILVLGSPCVLAASEEHGETTVPQEVGKKTDIELDIELTGLITLVRENCKMGKTTAIHAIMMRDPDMEHGPRLLVDAEDAQPPNDPTEILAVPGGKQYLVWDLTGYRIELPTPPAISINESPLGPKPDSPKDRAASENFSWIATLDGSCKAKGKDQDVDKGAVREKELPDYASARLMRIPVTEAAKAKGVLNARFDVEDDADLPREGLYEFNADYVQALADGASIRMKLTVPAPWVIKLVPFDKHKETIEIRLQQADLTITLSNLPAHQQTYNAEKDRLNHFKRFEKLLPEGQRANCMAPIRKPESGAAPVKCTLCSSCGPLP